MEGREISQEFAEQSIMPEIHSFEDLTNNRGLSKEAAMKSIEDDQSILDLWSAANNPESLKGH